MTAYLATHGAFIFAAYAITALITLGMIGAILADYRSLRRALAKFPPRRAEMDDA